MSKLLYLLISGFGFVNAMKFPLHKVIPVSNERGILITQLNEKTWEVKPVRNSQLIKHSDGSYEIKTHFQGKNGVLRPYVTCFEVIIEDPPLEQRDAVLEEAVNEVKKWIQE